MDAFVLIDSLRGETQHIPIARWPLRGEPSGKPALRYTLDV
jgi:hypothetical protein